MKKIVAALSLSFTLIFTGGCLKSSDSNTCTPKTVQSEQAQIVAYAAANGITATAHSTGLYYQVTNTGSGATPTLSSKVFVTYTGKLTNGTVFDSQTNATLTGWTLGSLIAGWQIGIPLIQKGGSIKLIVPSSMAYGCQGVGTIPANSILYFEITLVDVQ
jgi:FKBP-type peptidyl-prolyl cis-trans isomerase